jgi:hypothetical protein
MTSPTCIIEFADGEVTRMSVWCEPGKRDEGRGIRLARLAYESRMRRLRMRRKPPTIKTIRWEARS